MMNKKKRPAVLVQKFELKNWSNLLEKAWKNRNDKDTFNDLVNATAQIQGQIAFLISIKDGFYTACCDWPTIDHFMDRGICPNCGGKTVSVKHKKTVANL